MNIDQSSFDFWLENDVTKVLLSICKEVIETNEQNILRNAFFTETSNREEIFMKGKIAALRHIVLEFDLEEIELYLKPKEEEKDE